MMLDVSDRQILIVGGGAVASRKAAGLAAAGAKHIRVLASEFRSPFSANVLRITKQYEPADLTECDLVFAATDSTATNDAVVRDARAMRIPVCRADGSDELPGDFSTPAIFQSGSLTVAVSAQSPALAAAIRDSLRDSFDPQWTAMADAMQALRPLIKASGRSSTERAALFRALATPQALKILHESGIDGLKNWILSLPAHTV